jgi:hypothetical protein
MKEEWAHSRKCQSEALSLPPRHVRVPSLGSAISARRPSIIRTNAGRSGWFSGSLPTFFVRSSRTVSLDRVSNRIGRGAPALYAPIALRDPVYAENCDDLISCLSLAIGGGSARQQRQE